MPHDRMLATRRTPTRGSTSTSSRAASSRRSRRSSEVTRDHTTLRVSDRLSFGSHYAETLRRWDDAFSAAHDRVRALGFDATFERMWHFYLEYSRAGFASGYLDVEQITSDASTTGDRHAADRRRRVEPFVGGELPVRLRAWDGSEAGPVDAPLVELRSPDAVRRLLWHPGELGAAQAYVTGEIEVHRRPRRDAGARLRGGPRARARRPSRQPGRAGPGGPNRRGPGLAPPRARRPGDPGADPRPAALEAARPLRDRPPLRLLQRLLRADPGPVDGLLVRLLDERQRGVHRRRRPARQARPGLPQARTRPPA